MSLPYLGIYNWNPQKIVISLVSLGGATWTGKGGNWLNPKSILNCMQANPNPNQPKWYPNIADPPSATIDTGKVKMKMKLEYDLEDVEAQTFLINQMFTLSCDNVLRLYFVDIQNGYVLTGITWPFMPLVEVYSCNLILSGRSILL